MLIKMENPSGGGGAQVAKGTLVSPVDSSSNSVDIGFEPDIVMMFTDRSANDDITFWVKSNSYIPLSYNNQTLGILANGNEVYANSRYGGQLSVSGTICSFSPSNVWSGDTWKWVAIKF